jgi:predicted metal-dependent peptidase
MQVTLQPVLKDDEVEAQKTRVMKAKFQMMRDHEFYAYMILATEFICTYNVPTMATDGEKMWYNPMFVHRTSVDAELKGVLKHEGKHIQHKHHLRGPHHFSPEEIEKMTDAQQKDVKFKHTKWNMATDHVINLELLAEGEVLPKGALKDPKYSGMSAEQVYRILPDEDVQEMMQQQGQGTPCDGDGNGTPMIGEVYPQQGEDGKPMSKSQKKQAAIEVDAKVINAAAMAKKAGNLPNGMDRYVEGITEDVVDWREIFRDLVEKACNKNDFDWRMPNKRYACQQGIYLPCLWGEDVSDIYLAMDTSGSIGQRELDFLAGQIATIVQTFDATVTVLYIDTKVQKTEVFAKSDLCGGKLKLHPQGGGGTNFIPAFDWIKKNQKVPKLFVYLTDLECSRYPTKPDYPVVWVYLKGRYSSGRYKDGVPFGEIVEVDMENL